MQITLYYTLLGYLCGSLLFERLYAILFHKQDAAALSEDHNPGVFNAFRYGGFQDGLFSLCGDLLKGTLPVLAYLHACPNTFFQVLPLVLAAPVLGHLYPVFFRFKGGKGIAVTFGVLLALWIDQVSAAPVLTFAALFLFFKLAVPVKPDFYLTILVYVLLPLCALFERLNPSVLGGLFLISLLVLGKLAVSKEPHAKLEVSFLWKR